MKSTFIKVLAFILFVNFSFVGCQKSDGVDANVEIQDFVWKAMNLFYLWQEDVPDLADSRFSTQGQLNDYLANFPDPAQFFQSILFQPGTVDRFSWIVDDYIALENQFQGLAVSNGMEFGLVRYANDPTNVFGYVRYVIPGSDAETQGVTRGMLFSEVDGQQLTDTNFNSLLFGNDFYTITLADFNNGDPIATTNTIALTKTQLQENPIHVRTTITDGSHKVGYLMYNQFAFNYDSQLNDAFAYFQSENITDLIIDLRYNGGGRANSARWMATMVTGQFTGQMFSQEVWNSKVQGVIDPNDFINNFTDQIENRDSNGQLILQETINKLNLTRVYFITTGSTASASELVINALDPYIQVSTVGTTTLGKVHGSITLYDSDNLTRNGDNLNPNHTWAIQPLVTEILNSNGTNQPNGIVPTVNLREDYGDLGVLGERSDPLLDRTMVLITTGNRMTFGPTLPPMDEIAGSKSNTPAFNNMYTNIKN